MESETAKAVVREYFRRLFDERDLSVCDALLANDYLDHDAPPGAPRGPAATKAFVSRFLQDYPDMQVRVVDLIASGDMVAARIIWRGTHRDTGAGYHQVGLVLVRLDAAGQVAERWSAYASLP